MYEQFYNLQEEPFRLSPDPRLCYLHASYKKAKAYMQYALHRSEGFVMITGQPGTGKTTLINDLISDISDGQTVFANITSTQVHAEDLLRMVALNFKLDTQTEHKSHLIHQLEHFLKQMHREHRRPLLIIDEAQDLAANALEELRLMTNIHQNNQPLLQIFLVGQEGLREMVLSPGLEQLHQRIIAACHLEPLDEERTEGYIKYRLGQVGWNNDPQLLPEIFPSIARFSIGIPRWINLICSRLLLHGMVEELHRLGTTDVRSVIQGLINEQLLPTPPDSEQEFLTREHDLLKDDTVGNTLTSTRMTGFVQISEIEPDLNPVKSSRPAFRTQTAEATGTDGKEVLNLTKSKHLPDAVKQSEPTATHQINNAPRSPATTVPLNILRRLNDKQLQGRVGRHLYNQLRKKPDITAQIADLKGASKSQIPTLERKFIQAFLAYINTLNIDGEIIDISLPQLENIGFRELKSVLEQGKEVNIYGVDSRLWSIIHTTFVFFLLELG